MTYTFAKQQSKQPVDGQMSIWHRCCSPVGIVGGIF